MLADHFDRNLNDFLGKTESDIITLLTTPPSTKTLSLHAGDVIYNVFLEIEIFLKDFPISPVSPIEKQPIVEHIK